MITLTCCLSLWVCFIYFVFFFKQKTAYDMRISDWSSDVCSSDLSGRRTGRNGRARRGQSEGCWVSRSSTRRFKESRDLVHILDARRAFDARRHIDERRAGRHDRFPDIGGVETAGDAQVPRWARVLEQPPVEPRTCPPRPGRPRP